MNSNNYSSPSTPRPWQHHSTTLLSEFDHSEGHPVSGIVHVRPLVTGVLHITSWLPGGSVVKNLPASAGDLRDTGSIPGSGIPPGEGNGTHSSILAWEIPWTEEPGGLQSMGSQ